MSRRARASSNFRAYFRREARRRKTRRHAPWNRPMRAAAGVSGGAAAIALALAIGAAPVAAQPQCAKLATVRVQEWSGDIINIVPWVADARGIFRAHCLDVK